MDTFDLHSAAAFAVPVNRGRWLIVLGGLLGLLLFAGRPMPAQEESGTQTVSFQQDHPRLLVPPGGWPAVLSRLQADPVGVLALAKLRANAEGMLAKPVVTGESDPRRDMLSQARGCQNRLVTLSMAYGLFREDRFLARARRELQAAAALDTWNPKHFLDTAELALGVALALDWLHGDLSAEDRALGRTALVDKALKIAAPLYETVSTTGTPADRRLWWAAKDSNWTSVCHTGLLAAALAIIDEEPDLAVPVVLGAPQYLRLPLGAYAPVGGYPEGPGYWSYGTTFQTLAGAMLESATGGDAGLFAGEPGFAATVLFPLHTTAPSGAMYNFSDVSLAWYDGVSPLLGYLGRRYGHPQAVLAHRERLAAELSDPAASQRNTARFFPYHLLWLPPPVSSAVPAMPRDAHYPGAAEVAVFRSAWNDPNALFLGFKGGRVDISHAHYDLGSFVLDADGVRWSSELGVDDYALPEYFGRLRPTYLRVNNRGHSTLQLNDALQDQAARGNITRWVSEDRVAGAVMDLSSAYPAVAQGWQRQAWMLDRSRVLIQDDLRGLVPGATLTWQMVTDAEIAIAPDGRRATLRRQEKTLAVEVLEPAQAVLSHRRLTPATPQENPNTDFNALVAVVHADAAHTARIRIRLRPVGAAWPAEVPEDERCPP